jgi:hypothetical protein
MEFARGEDPQRVERAGQCARGCQAGLTQLTVEMSVFSQATFRFARRRFA